MTLSHLGFIAPIEASNPAPYRPAEPLAELCGTGQEVLHVFEITGWVLRRDEIRNREKPDAV